MIKLRRMRLLGLVARKWAMRKPFYILIGKSQRTDCLGEVRVKERVIFKKHFKEEDVRIWTTFSYRSMWFSGCLLWTRCWNFGFHNTWRIALSPRLSQRQNKRLAPWSCSRVQCFVYGDLIDSEAVSRLLPSNSNRPSYCEGHGSALRDDQWPIRFIFVCHRIQPSSMLYNVLFSFEQWVLFDCLLTIFRQFVHCDLLHFRSTASLIQNRAGSLVVWIGIYSNGLSLVMLHCKGPPPLPDKTTHLLHPKQLFPW